MYEYKQRRFEPSSFDVIACTKMWKNLNFSLNFNTVSKNASICKWINTGKFQTFVHALNVDYSKWFIRDR